MKRLICMLLASAMCLTILVGCGSSSSTENEAANTAVMTINGEDVPASELAAYIVYNMSYYENYFGMDASYFTDDTTFSSVKESCANQVTTLRAIKVMAEDLGVSLDSNDKKELKDTKNSNIEQVGGYTGFKAWIAYTVKGEENPWETYLNNMGYTEELYDQDSEIMKLESKIVDYYYDQGDITTEFHDTYLHAKSILISDSDEDGNLLTGDEFDSAKAQAKDIQKQINDGANFDELFTEYNSDTAQGDDGYYFTEGDMVDEYYSAVSGLKDNETTSKVVYYEGYGWFIIERLPLDDNALTDTSAYMSNQGSGDTSTIKSSIGDTLVQNKLQDYIDQMDVQNTDEYDKITVYNVNTYLGFVTDPLVASEGSGSAADGSAGGASATDTTGSAE